MAISVINELGRDSKNWASVKEEIVRLERKIFPEFESLARSFGEEQKKNCGLLYLVVEGEVAGFVMYSWLSSLCASITNLAVKENYRRQGYGEALLKAAVEKCRSRNIQIVCLHVDPSRTAAFDLYRKLGFQILKQIKCYYSPDRHAYRMYLKFNSKKKRRPSARGAPALGGQEIQQ